MAALCCDARTFGWTEWHISLSDPLVELARSQVPAEQLGRRDTVVIARLPLGLDHVKRPDRQPAANSAILNAAGAAAAGAGAGAGAAAAAAAAAAAVAAEAFFFSRDVVRVPPFQGLVEQEVDISQQGLHLLQRSDLLIEAGC